MEPPRITKVFNLINSLSLHKWVGHDNIPPHFLKVASNIIAPALCYFFDNAFLLGIFAQSCKIAKVVPLCKSGSTENLSNYQPISILTCFSKILEKLIYTRLSAFVQKHFVFTKTQYEFQRDKSTTHAVLDVITAVYDHINDNEYTCLALLDFKKAFDTVKHSILIKKLEHYRIHGVTLDLLTSFLTNRKQYVAHKDNFSDV